MEHWKDEETRALVKIRIKYDYFFTGSKGNAVHGWRAVVNELNQLGITRASNKKFQTKWSDELIKYKNFCEPSRRHTGVGTEDGNYFGSLDPEVYEMLAKYHEPKHNFHPPALVDTSMPSTSKLNNEDHSYSTANTDYLGTTIPDEYLEVGRTESVGLDNEETEDDDDPVCVTASSSKRCSEYYKKANKKQKSENKQKKNDDNDWMKAFLIQNREDRKEEMAQLVGVIKDLIPK